jgi:hypothetical protein
MKARDLKPGDTVDGWTVTYKWTSGTFYAQIAGGDIPQIILLTLEREQLVYDKVYPGGAQGGNFVGKTRRTWFPANEEVTP